MTKGRRWTGRLVWRVYLYGILMLALAGGASFVVGTYLITPAVERPARPSTAWIAWHLMSRVERGDDISAELKDLADSELEMTIFDARGQRLASNAADPPPPLDAEKLNDLRGIQTEFADGAGTVASLDASGNVRSYVRLRYPKAVLPMGTAIAQLAVALCVLGLLSIPLARSITARVDRLTDAARAFGAGDLAVRVNSPQRDEIGELTRAFDEMADRIVQLRHSEKELLANISHEMRTPLARIRMALDLVQDGDINQASRYLTDIEEDLEELEQLLDDVMTAARLDLARGEIGDSQAPLHLERVEAERVIDAACQRFRRRFPDRRLEREIARELPLIEADPTLLRRVLDNLLDNAAKYSNPDQVVELRAQKAPDTQDLIIEVQDHGTGIAAENVDRVFEPFFRADRSRDRATGGVGLGLALVKRILDAHAGKVQIQSSNGHGTCFRLTLPRAHA